MGFESNKSGGRSKEQSAAGEASSPLKKPDAKNISKIAASRRDNWRGSQTSARDRMDSDGIR